MQELIGVSSQDLTCRVQLASIFCSIMGGDLGGLEDGPAKILDGGTAHASVPPIFGEVVLLEACETTKRKRTEFFSVK